MEKLSDTTQIENNRPEEKTSALEAKLLRMDGLWQNAISTKNLFEFLEKNFNASEEEIRNFADGQKINDSEIKESFILELCKRRNAVVNCLDTAKKEAERKGKTVAEMVFEWLHDGFENPEGNSASEVYPLAVVLCLESQGDYEKIRLGGDLGGFFTEYQSYYWEKETGGYGKDTFPCIAVNTFGVLDANPLLLHEKGHAENNIIIKVSNTSQGSVFWSRYPKVESRDLRSKVARINGLLEKDPDSRDFIESEDWQILLDQILYRAKDELLAEIKSVGFNIRGHFDSLKFRGGTYDYIQTDLKIKPGSKIYDLLWQDYEHYLTDAYNAIKRISDGYNRCMLFNPTNRFKTMRFILAQIPIQEWPKELEENLFYEEIKLLDRASNRIDEIFDKYRETYDDQKMRDKFEPMVDLGKKLRARLSEMVEMPIVKTLEKFLAQVSDFD